MAIRVFINQWTEQQDGDLLYIKDPIDDYLNDVSLSAPVVSQNHFARIALNRRPDRLYLIKVMRGNLADAEWATLGNLQGVRMVPPGKFDDPISSIRNPVKNQIYTALDSMGIPRTTFDSAATIGGFLRNLLTELGGDATGFGAWELDAAEWG